MSEEMKAYHFNMLKEKRCSFVSFGFLKEAHARNAIDWLVAHTTKKMVTVAEMLKATDMYDAVACRFTNEGVLELHRFGWSAKMLLPWCWASCKTNDIIQHPDSMYYIHLPYPRIMRTQVSLYREGTKNGK